LHCATESDSDVLGLAVLVGEVEPARGGAILPRHSNTRGTRGKRRFAWQVADARVPVVSAIWRLLLLPEEVARSVVRVPWGWLVGGDGAR
jgi:hypothetical protein